MFRNRHSPMKRVGGCRVPSARKRNCTKMIGYCWRTQKCRNFCLTHAFLEGQEAWVGLLKKPQSQSIEVGSPTVSVPFLRQHPAHTPQPYRLHCRVCVIDW